MSRTSFEPRSVVRNSGRWGLASLAYALLIIYGSLYPFTGWTTEQVKLFAYLAPNWSEHIPRADLLTNVLAYGPFGLLLARWWHGRGSMAGAIVVATLLSGLLSFAMESLQQFLPSRVASLSDFIANTVGALCGAAVASVMHSESPPWVFLMRRRDQWFVAGRLVDMGLVAVTLWVLSQLTPLVPSLDVGKIRQGLSPIWQTIQHPERFNVTQWATYALYITGLALLVMTTAVRGQAVFIRFFALVACVLLGKIVIVMRQLSLEAASGAFCALLLALPLLLLRGKALAVASAVFILGGFTLAELASSPGGALHAFNWVPFVGHMENPLIGIASILEDLWPAATLAYLARFASAPPYRGLAAWSGGLALALVVFGLEWYQQYVPGRYGDFTTVLLAGGTWVLFWSIPIDRVQGQIQTERRDAGRHGLRWQSWAIVGTLGLAVATGVAALVSAQRPVEVRVDESKLPQLPTPEQLPPVNLPGFKYAHPRLPHPSASDLATLASRSREILRQLRGRAGADNPRLEDAILQEVVAPGSVDLARLHRRLMELKPTWRGDEGKPLALAYDWLYSRWSESQRAELRDKLVEASQYLISLIRDQRLSPYNVVLYNSPLQTLMACSLALYGDDPRGEPIMRFTYDMWKNRVLPAWRQVMGRNGGWHEGGEYVGIGIGQAVYELPAMWRSATGEDLIAAEPGIRGFLDFLVYRAQPDGMDFRWGDGTVFDRVVPDAAALALELHHAASYSLRARSADIAPSAWPWGPLTDPSLRDPNAVARLPLVRYFDGIGMIVARSDWSPDATYVTFKAGDNYWSHTHLDQGAFTIYKGGALAIDSGLYGPVYGSDHHMNYTYQTIAHNAITVTDPEDSVPAPGKDTPRPIANDGGQRRIGSGWGVEAAPIDRAEWEAKRDIYHTASMGPLLDRDGLVVGAADLTPAYTNSQSGNGSFSARTRRVERLWRIFGYDRVDDVVVVFDQVTATKAAFRKRWLLHTIERPSVGPDGFSAGILPRDRPGHGGGRLEGKVLLPKEAIVNVIGGPGLEFFVDSKNYDEDGKLADGMRKLGSNNGEPGAWRIEVSPPQDAIDDIFLVVLLPTGTRAHAVPRVRLLESAGRVGCEIVGASRTTRWWFERGKNGAEVELSEGGRSARYVAKGPEESAPERRSWLSRARTLFGVAVAN